MAKNLIIIKEWMTICSSIFLPLGRLLFPLSRNIVWNTTKKGFSIVVLNFLENIFRRHFVDNSFDDGSDESKKRVVWTKLVQGRLQQRVGNPTTATTATTHVEEKDEADVCGGCQTATARSNSNNSNNVSERRTRRRSWGTSGFNRKLWKSGGTVKDGSVQSHVPIYAG